MASNGKLHSSGARWVSKTVELALPLHPSFLKSQVPFFKLISANEGYPFIKDTIFIVVKQKKNCFIIHASFNIHPSASDHLRFGVSESLEKVGIVCSKLNLASSHGCKIKAFLRGKDVIFHISFPNATIEQMILKHYYSLFDGE